ncbi:uncharacterized protein SCDLUD_004641 [Saccharomycodes ludwigii]|uniref:uncharacterized protein n=1 Tax=Saccharomycodes ludwigii TaxID=36035 RepID=UPI001E8975C6|nr:hypothetical protein SCDLUD_004641 [Saccharomycodes ludwigii]KAH3899210.1 hypothetical protein SCDLUD_004641 [Saccharomycodes ludwigii]
MIETLKLLQKYDDLLDKLNDSYKAGVNDLSRYNLCCNTNTGHLSSRGSTLFSIEEKFHTGLNLKPVINVFFNNVDDDTRNITTEGAVNETLDAKSACTSSGSAETNNKSGKLVYKEDDCGGKDTNKIRKNLDNKDEWVEIQKDSIVFEQQQEQVNENNTNMIHRRGKSKPKVKSAQKDDEKDAEKDDNAEKDGDDEKDDDDEKKKAKNERLKEKLDISTENDNTRKNYDKQRYLAYKEKMERDPILIYQMSIFNSIGTSTNSGSLKSCQSNFREVVKIAIELVNTRNDIYSELDKKK